MAQSMALSRDSVMACSVFDDADLHSWGSGRDYTTRVLRAITAGVRTEPGLNAWFDGKSQSRTLFEHIDVGIAVDTIDGLLVPVIRHVEKRSAAQLRVELDRLKRAARDRTVGSEELRNFTFMLSNFGSMAGRYATPIVVPPAVAILGTGRVRRDVIAAGERVEIHTRMPLSLTFDHRVDHRRRGGALSRRRDRGSGTARVSSRGTQTGSARRQLTAALLRAWRTSVPQRGMARLR